MSVVCLNGKGLKENSAKSMNPFVAYHSHSPTYMYRILKDTCFPALVFVVSVICKRPVFESTRENVLRERLFMEKKWAKRKIETENWKAAKKERGNRDFAMKRRKQEIIENSDAKDWAIRYGMQFSLPEAFSVNS